MMNLLKEHTNLNSQEKKQREEVWKKVVVQALSDGVGTSNTSSLSDNQYSELYHLCSQLHLFLQGFRNLVRKIQALKITIYEKELNEKQIELEFAARADKAALFPKLYKPDTWNCRQQG